MNVLLRPHSAVGEAVMLSGRAKMYHKAGYKVYLHSESGLKSNPEAVEMLFSKNPYISGEKDEEDGDIVNGVIVVWNPDWTRENVDPAILSHKNVAREDRPLELFYKPTIRPELKDIIGMDLNISSYRLGPALNPAGGGAHKDRFDLLDGYVMDNYGNSNVLSIQRAEYDIADRPFELLPTARKFPALTYDTIYDYCDIVASCKEVLCLQTGSQMLASYYNKNTTCLLTVKNANNIYDTGRLVYISGELSIINLA